MPMPNQAYIFGHSCRSLGESLHRLGFQIKAFDDYADRDLRRVATCFSIDEFDRELSRIERAKGLDSDERPLLFLAGGAENALDRLRRVEKEMCVAGPASSVIAQLRCLEVLASLAESAQLNFPGVVNPRDVAEVGKHWPLVVKPTRSGGGQSIKRLDEAEEAIEVLAMLPSSERYVQRWIEGHATSVTWLIEDSQVALLGCCKSLGPEDWPGPTPFLYRGSIACEAVERDVRTRLVKLGERVRDQYGYRGLLQADFVVDSSGRWWLLEFNPRWAASFEVVERQIQMNLAALHLQALKLVDSLDADSSFGKLEVEGASSNRGQRYHGKAILYARRDTQIDESQSNWLFDQTRSSSSMMLAEGSVGAAWLADIPMPGTYVLEGQPILTILASDESESRLMSHLSAAANAIEERLDS